MALSGFNYVFLDTCSLMDDEFPEFMEVLKDSKDYLDKNVHIVLLEQVRTIDKHRLKEKMGKLDDDAMQRVNEAIGISFGLSNT